MKRFCVIGYPLSHSFSPGYFQEKFKQLGLQDYSYTARELEDINLIKPLIETAHLSGFNVTIPHKQGVIAHLDEIDAIAAEIGSVNCVKVVWGKNAYHTKGYNTDWIGFSHLLNMLSKKPKKALIFGTGGAALAVNYALEKAGIDRLSVSRGAMADAISYSAIDEKLISECDLIVNTTPVGMYPNINEKPNFPYHLLTSNHALIDLIYNPLRTAFLLEGERNGCQVLNGLEMLHIQAEASWEIWMSPQL